MVVYRKEPLPPEKAKPRQMYVVNTDDGAAVKRVEYQAAKIMLISSNPDYPVQLCGKLDAQI